MRIFSPKRYVASVDRIDLNTLWADGKRAILLDRDNTLVPARHRAGSRRGFRLARYRPRQRL